MNLSSALMHGMIGADVTISPCIKLLMYSVTTNSIRFSFSATSADINKTGIVIDWGDGSAQTVMHPYTNDPGFPTLLQVDHIYKEVRYREISITPINNSSIGALRVPFHVDGMPSCVGVPLRDLDVVLASAGNSINMNHLPTLGRLAFSYGGGERTLNISGLTELYQLYSYQSGLVEITLPPNGGVLKYATITNNLLPSSEINKLLTALVASGITSGTLSCKQQTAAPPTGDGITAKATLIGRGWTVTTD